MASALTSKPSRARPATPAPLRFSRADYYRMAETGIIGPEDRVELLDGEIYQMSPIGSPHSGIVGKLDRLFQSRIGARAICRVQQPLILDDRSEPEPDFVVARSRADEYCDEHPRPADVLLLVEVSDTSSRLDLGRKRALYARAGIAEYWVLDLVRRTAVVNRDPRGDVYASVQEYGAADKIAPLAFPDIEVALKPLLG